MNNPKDIRRCFLVALLIFAFGCGKNEPANSAQPLEKPVDEIVEPVKNEEGFILFDKDAFLNKDLILGAEIRDVASSKPIEDIGGLIMEFLPTTLIRFVLPEEDSTQESKEIQLRMIKSPYIPWKRLPREYPHHELGTILAEERSGGKIAVKAEDFGKLLTAQSTDGTGISVTPLFVEKKLISVDENYLVIPLQAKLSVEEVTLFLSFVVHLKRWEPAETLKRTIHKDFGYFTLFEWGSWGEMDSYQVRAKRFPEDPILSWNLEGRTEPLTYILMDSVPHEYRSLFKEAIESWNISFRKAGYEKDIVRVREQKPDEKLLIGDPRKHLVFWESDVFRGFSGAHASFQVDPITGEMYHADVYFGGEKLIRALKRSYEYYYPTKKDQLYFSLFKETHQLSPIKLTSHKEGVSPIKLSFAKTSFQKICSYEPASFILENHSKISQEEFIRMWLLEVMIHEVGHNWGLRHNFKGSLGASAAENHPTNSVMDYNDDSLILNNLFLKNPGVYDDEAIAYGYQRSLGDSKIYPFCTDEDLEGGDPRCAPFDAGANPLHESLIPDAEKVYIKLMSAEEYLDQVKYLRYFASRFFSALSFLQLEGTEKDKYFLNESIVRLTDLKEVSEGDKKYDLSRSWLYDLIRPQLIDITLMFASIFSESKHTLHSLLLNRSQLLIRADADFISNIDARTREKLLDDLYLFRFHPQKEIQRQVLDALIELQNQFEVEKSSLEQQGARAGERDFIRLQDVSRFAELVENRIKTFFGRAIGDRR